MFSGNNNYSNRKYIYDLLTAHGEKVGSSYEEFMSLMQQPKKQQQPKQQQQARPAARQNPGHTAQSMPWGEGLGALSKEEGNKKVMEGAVDKWNFSRMVSQAKPKPQPKPQPQRSYVSQLTPTMNTIYDILKDAGEKVGSVQQFQSYFERGYGHRKAIYDKLVKLGAFDGSYNEFAEVVGLKPKNALTNKMSFKRNANNYQINKEAREESTLNAVKDNDYISAGNTMLDSTPIQADEIDSDELQNSVYNTINDVLLSEQRTDLRQKGVGFTNSNIDNGRAQLKQDGFDPVINSQIKYLGKVYDRLNNKYLPVYQTTDGKQYHEALTADKAQRYIDVTSMPYRETELRRRKQELEDAINKRGSEIDRATPTGYALGGVAAMGLGSAATPNNAGFSRLKDTDYLTLQANLKEVDEALGEIEEAKKGLASDKWIANSNGDFERFGKRLFGYFGGSYRGFMHSIGKVSTWDFGLSDIEAAMGVARAVRKADKVGFENLSKEQQKLLNDAAQHMMISQEYAHLIGRGYKAGQVTAESLPFMLEMIVNPASSMGKAAQQKVVRSLIKKFGKDAIRKSAQKYLLKKYGARVVGDALGASVMASTTGSGRVYADTRRRMTGDLNYNVNESGEAYYDGHEKGESFVKAFAKAFGAQAIENHSEMLGEYIKPLLGVVGKTTYKGLTKATAKNLYTRFGVNKVRSMINDVMSTPFAKFVSDLESRAKWNGMLGEYAEEVIGNVENALLVGDNTLDADENTGVFDLDQNIDTFLGVSLMGGFVSSVKTGYYLLRGKKRLTLNEMNKAGRAIDSAFSGNIQLMNTWGGWRNTILLGTDEEKKSVLREILDNKSIPMNVRMRILDYAKSAQEYQGIVKAQQIRRYSSDEASVLSERIDNSADEGYEATNEQKNAIRRAYRRAKKKFDSVFGEQAKELLALDENELFMLTDEMTTKKANAIYDYLDSKSRYEGMLYAVQDKVNDAVDDSNKSIDERTHTDGTLIKATMNVDDRQVYIVNGNIVLRDDGSIDMNNSDKSIVIVDAETNKREMVAPSAFKSVDTPVSAEEVKAKAAQEVTEQITREESDIIDGKLDFNVGDTYDVVDQDDNQFSVQIIEDKGDNVVVQINGQQTEMAKADVQKMYDDYVQLQDEAEDNKDGNAEAQEESQSANELKEGSYVSINGVEYTIAEISDNNVTLVDSNGKRIPWSKSALDAKLKSGDAEVLKPTADVKVGDVYMDNDGDSFTITRIEDNNVYVADSKGVEYEEPYEISVFTDMINAGMLTRKENEHASEAEDNASSEGMSPASDEEQNDNNSFEVGDRFETADNGKKRIARILVDNGNGTIQVVFEDTPFSQKEWKKSDFQAKIDNGTFSYVESVTYPFKVGDVFKDNNNVNNNVNARIIEDNGDGTIQYVFDDEPNRVITSPKYFFQKYIDKGQLTPIEATTRGAEDATPDTSEPQNESMPMKTVGKGKNARQQEDWLSTTPKRGYDYLFNEVGLKREEAKGVLDAYLAEAQKKLDAERKKEVKFIANVQAYKEKKIAREKRITELQAEVDYWKSVKDEYMKVLLEEKRERDAKDAADHDQAVEDELKRKEDEARKKAEAEARGSNAVSAEIRDKWNEANKIVGAEDEVTLPNGETITGHYILVESGAATPSHQSTNGFEETEGFPVDQDGKNVNDRDYKRDKEAQQITLRMGENYDQRAIQSPIVVSQDGVVLSGNGRTMAGEIAAQNGTDIKYNDYLRKYGNKYGFTQEQIAAYQHPRVVFVPDVAMPYNSETFAKFNQREQKSQNRTETAVKMGKLVSDDLFGRVMSKVNEFSTLGEFYANDKATTEVIKELAAAGVIPQTEMAGLFDGGKLSEVGQGIVEGVMIGKAFQANPDAVRQITEIKSMRQAVMTALQDVAINNRLGNGYDLSNELAAAIDLVYKARKAGFQLGQHVSQYAHQGNLFQLDDGATVADFNNAAVMMLADVLNDKRVTILKQVISSYNAQAENSSQGIGDLLSGGAIRSKEEIINEINQLYNNGQEYNRTAETASDRQGRGSQGSEQGTVDSESNSAGKTRELANEFNALATELNTAEGEERMRVLGEMRDCIAHFAEENGYPVPEFLLTRGDFLAAVPEKDRAKVEQWLDDGWHCPAYYEKGKVYYFVEGCDNFDKDVSETLSHEYTHADNAEYPENVNALTYAVEDTHEVSQDELIDILETLSNSSHYEEKAERLESEGKNSNPMLADEVIAHAVSLMVVNGKQTLDGITKNPTLQFIIKRAYKVRENERQHYILGSKASERSSKTSKSSETNSRNSQSVAEGESQLGRYGRSTRSETNSGRTEETEVGKLSVNDGRGDKGRIGERQGNQEKTEESSELDDNGIPFVKSSNGTTIFGEIRDDSGLTPAPIKLSEGFQDENGKGYGLAHIEAGHGIQIRNAGFKSVEDFVSFIAQNYDEDNIRVGKRRVNGNTTYLIQVSDEHDNTLFIEMSRDNSYWNVNSAGIFRKGYSNKKETVAKTEPQQPNNAISSDSSLSDGKHNGIMPSEPNGESTVSSDSKVINNQSTLQENAEKSVGGEGETSLSAQIEAASTKVNTEPTEAQKEAGNYKKGNVQVGTFDITIEQPKGSVRKGTDADGKHWESKMNNTYGYIRGAVGVDGDHIDVFLSNDIDGWNGRKVFVVDQYNPDGSFDEHKVMLGFNDADEAKSDYLANYENGWEDGRRIDVSAVNLEDFEKWIASSKRKTKPFGEYSLVKKTDNQGNPLNADGTLKLEKVKSVDDLTDEDFSKPTRSVELPHVPENVDNALGADGKPVIIKKNIFEKNWEAHKFPFAESRSILKSALYNTDLIGQTQPTKRPLHWVAIKLDEKSPIVVLEVNENKDNVEIVGWYTLDGRNLERIKRQAEKNGGELVMLSPKDKVESLSTPQHDLSSDGKGKKKVSSEQGYVRRKNVNGENESVRQQKADIVGAESMAASKPSKSELVLRDAVIDHLRENGMDVITDEAEGQSVLDMANGADTRFEAARHKSKEAEERDKQLRTQDLAIAIVTGKTEQQVRAERRERERRFKEETKELYERVLSGNFDDVTLRLIDNYINQVTPYNYYGRPLSKRLPPRVGQKVSRGEQTGSIDAFFSRISESAVGANERTRPEARRRIEEKKKELLKAWAIATGNWHTSVNDFTNANEPLGRGKDSDVYVSKDGDYVIKVSKGKDNLKRFRPDMDNVALFNYVFPNSSYDIVGYGEIDGKFVRFLRQPIVDFTDSIPLSVEERVAYMEHLGFKPINDEKTAFSNGQIVAADIQKNNIVKDKQGNIRVIDADMRLHTKDMGGDYAYPPVERDTELNANIREHRVYHGSGADFDAFDHSHMGEGEGSQSFGWGTYVTNSETIGKSYAKRSMTGSGLKRAELESNISRAKEQLPFVRGEVKEELEAKIRDWETQLENLDESHHLYTVEIPEDNGKNYLDWNAKVGVRLLNKVNKHLEQQGKRPINPELDKRYKFLDGNDLYRALSIRMPNDDATFNDDKAASEFLSSLGFVGIKYPAGSIHGGVKEGDTNYVIFNEKDAQITDHVRFFRTANGEAYGFTVGGKIYIDPKVATSETPVHEYAHLWATALKTCNPNEWQNVVSLMKGTSVWNEVKKLYPELKSDDEIADEVLATYSGRRGAERLREEMKKAAAEKGNIYDKAAAVNTLQRVKQAIDKFWKAVADFLHIHYESAEQVADQVMKDLLNGVDPRSMMDGGKTLRPDTRINVVEGNTEHGFKNYAEAKDRAKEQIARTYSSEETGGKGDIRISNAAINKYLSQSAVDKSDSKDVHLSVLKVLPDVIRESVDAEQHADYKKGEDGVRSAKNGINPNVTIHRLYGAVRMGGRLYRVKVTLKEDIKSERSAKKAYSYEATKIELLAGTLGKPEGDAPNTNNSITAAKLLNGVEKSNGDGKFFEDYNKVREQFIGEQGAERADHAEEVSTRLDNLSVAREMEAEKKDAKAIKMATGWERGADGKWRYEIADMKEFDRNGNLLYRKHHPDYARYIELQDKDLNNLFEDGEELTDKEREEYEVLSKKYESDKFGGEKLDNNHTLEAYVDAPELFKAYPELKDVGFRFEDTGGNEIASYRYISSVFEADKDDVGEIVVNTGKVSKNTRTREVKSAVLHEIQHAIQEIEGFARGGNPKSMQERFEAAKKEWRARAWADALRDKADEMGEHYNQVAVEKALIDEYKEMGMDNEEWMPDKETRMKGFNYFARGYADRSMDADIKNFRLNESTRADFSPYVEYTRLGGEVESRNVEARMGMSAEERRASLAAETEDVSREDQLFLFGNNEGGSYSLKDGSAHSGRGKNVGEASDAEGFTAFANQYGVDAEVVKDYASGMKTGNLQKAEIALAEIRRTMRVANRGMKLSEFGKLFRPVQKELTERYGDIEKLRQEYIDAVMRERGVMEAARKRAEEEEAKRKARADELSLLSTEELDKRYFDAIENGDDATAREMLDEAARRKGYDDTESDYQGVGAWSAPENPGYESDKARRDDLENSGSTVNLEDIALGYTPQPDDYFYHPEYYSMNTPHGLESVKVINAAIDAIKNGEEGVKVKVYRAVPTSVKEGKLRNGDWVTPSKKYAEMHGNGRLEGKYRIIEDEVPANELWWDGNDGNEWGFDDGRGYKYKNVENNRKLNDLVTRDDNGEIIPPSKRFDENVEDVRYRESEPKTLKGEEALAALENIFNEPTSESLPSPLSTLENFREVFSRHIRTFLGELVKVKDEVFNKIIRERRANISGAILSTIENADFAIRDTDGSTLYVKRYKSDNSGNTYNVVAVNKHGEVEDYVSSVHIKRDGNLRNKIKNGAELLLPQERNTDGILSRNNSTPAAKVVKDFGISQLSPSEKSKHQVATDLARQMHIEGVVDVLESSEGLSGRKARAKGWFDPVTGRITIVLSKNENAADVARTIFHEAAAHLGLRELVGKEHYDTFLDNIYNNAEKRIQDEIKKKADEKYKGNLRRATDEYMAELAEDGEFVKQEHKSFLQQIKDSLISMLRKVGIKLDFELNDNDLRYILWRSWKNLAEGNARNIYQMAEDARMQDRLLQTPESQKRHEQEILLREANESIKNIVEDTKKKLEQLNEDKNSKRKDAVELIGGQLSKLHEAMRVQREYDMHTVASITELAQAMLKIGMLKDLSNNEANRILSVVKNVHGKRDISQYVQNVFDIMIDNQLKNSNAQLTQLLMFKGKKKDARGVEVQGKLDVEGQRIADVVWHGLGMSDEALNNLMSDLTERMNSSSDVIAKNAKIDYAACELLKQYNETIRDSKSEEKELRASLAAAKEDLDAGNMDHNAYLQYRDEVHASIRENKMERIEAYQAIVNRLGGMYGESMERAKQWREAEIERVKEIHHNANSDMEGRPCYQHYKPTAVSKAANSSLLYALTAPLGTFEEMLRMFGNKNVRGEGYLWNRYMRGFVDARNNEVEGYWGAMQELDDKVAEVFGKGKKWSDLFSIERKLPKGEVRIKDGNEVIIHELPQGNLLYIYMVNKMSDGRMKLRKMDITEATIEDIESMVDPKLKKIADWLQDEFLVKRREKYNKVHERMFGASMAAIDNYFPLKILKNAIAQNTEIENKGNDNDRASTITGSIKKRTRNSLALDIMNADAFSVVIDHIKEMEHWAAFAEWNRDLNTLLSYKRFRNQVINMSSVYGAGNELLSHFEKVCQIAAGVYKPSDKKFDKVALNIAKGVTGAKVTGRVFTAFKQLTSYPAYLSDANPLYLANNLLNPAATYEAWKWSMENLPMLRERFQGRFAGDPLLMSNKDDWSMWRSKVAEFATKYGMAPNAFVDALTISMGTHAVYKTKLAKYLRMGYSEEQADKRAKQDATISYNMTQQSSEGAFMSMIQSDRTWITAVVTAFRNSSISYTRMTYNALRNTLRRFKPGYRGMSEEFMAKQMEREGIDPNKASEYAKREYRLSVIRDFVTVGVFAYILPFVWNLTAYTPYLLFGDDDDKKKDMWSDIFTHTMFGSVEGLALGDMYSATLNSLYRSMFHGEDFNANNFTKDLPFVSDINTMVKDFQTKEWGVGLTDVINIMIQSGIGINPQTLTDAVVAIYDYCGADEKTPIECALLIMRIMNCPQSQMDKIYFDELDMTGAEAKQLKPAEIAKRYAEYKAMREAPIRILIPDDGSAKARNFSNAEKRAKEDVNAKLQTEETKQLLNEYKETAKKLDEIGKLKDEDEDAYIKQMQNIKKSDEYKRYKIVGKFKAKSNKFIKIMLNSENPEERKAAFKQLQEFRDSLIKSVNEIQ